MTTPEIETLLEEEVKASYIDYAMSVIIGRALPDVRDGLKPVQRRILYAMRELGLTPGRPFRKSATVVGDVIGKFHPHGDSPVYDALVRMAQDFALRYPLVDGQGNFGSIDGDPPAAYRYTEARLTHIAMELMEDLDEETVDFIPNFDGRLNEPVVLPGKFPNLLANGTTGIAVGMATNIPPHNIREIVDALLLLINNPDVEEEELFKVIKGPDFPTGGVIVGTQGIREAYTTGRGKIILRGKWKIEDKKTHKQIVITEIPYALSKTLLIEKIAELVRNKKIDGISDLRDESDREGLRLVVELKRGVNEDLIINQLLSHTPLQTSYGIILLALVDDEPKILTLKELLQEHIRHRINVVERRTKYRLRKAENRAHVLQGFLIALENIDEVIEIIKSSSTPSEAKSALIERFEFSEHQAQAILEMRLQTLTGLEREKIEKEYQEVSEKITQYKAILESRELLMNEIKKELEYIKGKYADARRTQISEESFKKLDILDLIPKEEVVITLTQGGYAKRTPLRSYRQQHRGGVGKTGVTYYEEDLPLSVSICNSHDALLVFTNIGRAYTLHAYQIHEGGARAKGKPLRTIIRLREDERVVALIPVRSFLEDDREILLITKTGIVKKTPIAEFAHAFSRGVIAQKLKEDDYVVSAIPVRSDDQIVIVKSDGKAARIRVSDIRSVGRQAKGVKGIKTDSAYVVSVERIVPGNKFLTITEKGYGKRVNIGSIRLIKRGGKGVIVQKVTKDTGRLVKMATVGKKDEIILLSQQGNIIRLKVSAIRPMGRNTKGVKLMRLKEDDKIIDVAVIDRSGHETFEMFDG